MSSPTIYSLLILQRHHTVVSTVKEFKGSMPSKHEDSCLQSCQITSGRIKSQCFQRL